MRVGLFIPCYVDQFYPQVGIATLELLEKFGCEVVYPSSQTCCGQPMANSGFEHLTKGCNDLFIKNFEEFDYIVSPSGSCVLHIKDHLNGEDGTETTIPKKIYEFVEFMTDVLQVGALEASFPFKAGYPSELPRPAGIEAGADERADGGAILQAGAAVEDGEGH
ncbi:heterodisulfide reductase-related iron-sulfur binding cluster [Puia sp. P3]|uniref:heterodisulfide reductase-related iron-sulfur binding cluster n=1 Tax=Puia sp. P3 TaxID=3423952 RepID=UPI003D679767